MSIDHDDGLTGKHTWIGELLAQGEGGRVAVWKRVAEVYHAPLVAFAKERFPREDSGQLVNDYLGNALEKQSWLHRWTPDHSRLSVWLFRGLVHFVRSQRTNEQRRQVTIEWDESLVLEPDAVVVQERLVRRRMLDAAIEGTRDEVAVDDAGRRNWAIFEAHWLEGVSYRDLAARFDLGEKQVEWKCRSVRDALRLRLRSLMRRDGVPESGLDQELRNLLSDLG